MNESETAHGTLESQGLVPGTLLMLVTLTSPMTLTVPMGRGGETGGHNCHWRPTEWERHAPDNPHNCPARDEWRDESWAGEKAVGLLSFPPAPPLPDIREQGGAGVNFEREGFELITFKSNRSGMNGD